MCSVEAGASDDARREFTDSSKQRRAAHRWPRVRDPRRWSRLDLGPRANRGLLGRHDREREDREHGARVRRIERRRLRVRAGGERGRVEAERATVRRRSPGRCGGAGRWVAGGFARRRGARGLARLRGARGLAHRTRAHRGAGRRGFASVGAAPRGRITPLGRDAVGTRLLRGERASHERFERHACPSARTPAHDGRRPTQRRDEQRGGDPARATGADHHASSIDRPVAAIVRAMSGSARRGTNAVPGGSR